MPVGMFKTKDGYMSVNARRDEHFRRLAKLIGKDEWLEDPRYADARSRVEHRDELMAGLRPIFETKTSDEWVELLSGIDILKAKVNTYEDLFDDPQVQAIDAVHWVENDTLGRVPMSTICGQRAPATGDRLTHAPHVGEHTREILGELGYAASDIERLDASGVVACYGA
jgi:crotonobetainyl-CoA:carnitine CoA-transferase CaiB-like acyl-CoA transferase